MFSIAVFSFKKANVQNAVFSFKKGSNCQNHSSGSHHPVKKIPLPAKFLITSHHSSALFEKPWVFQVETDDIMI